jgi:hypothetical protein
LVSSLFLAAPAFAQFPPSEPGRLPGSIVPGNSPGVTVSNGPGGKMPKEGFPAPKPQVALVRAEKPVPLGTIDVVSRNGNWQVMAGSTLFTNCGDDWKTAEKVANTLRALQLSEVTNDTAAGRRDIQQTAWVGIGESRPVVGYLTAKGEAAREPVGILNPAMTIDMATVRAEQVRGVWVVRDYKSILLNFGQEQREAEQAVAAIHKYGFNRIGIIGSSDAAALRYFFAQADDPRQPRAPVPNVAQVAMMELSLDGTGVDIPGVGTVGQKTNLDARKLTVRKDGTDFVIANGPGVLAKFGRDEWSARDALRILQQLNPTAVVRVGSPGITFFLNGAEVSNRLPFGTIGAAFESDRLTVRKTQDGVFHLYEPLGRDLATARTAEEMESIRAAIKHFKLNRTCQIGSTPATAMTFLGRVQ